MTNVGNPVDVIGTCSYCGLSHQKVESNGLAFCPNVLCPGPGAYFFRSQLPSYTGFPNGKYSVDKDELLKAADAFTKLISTDNELVSAIRKSALKLRLGVTH